MNQSAINIRAFASHFPSVPERCYVRGKLATDPLYPAVYEVLQSTRVPLLDIGCGMGVLAFYLRQRGFAHPITGIDYDERKIITACALTEKFGAEMQFFHRDATAGLPDHSGSVTILDILQYFPAPARDVMLRVSAQRVSREGVLIIRTGLVDDSWRFHTTRMMDYVASGLRWMKSPPIHYPVAEELTKLLADEGLIGSFRPLWGNTPFNNWLGVFQREDANV